jgi:type II secretory pathway predicted ATPase ExeA
MFTTYWEMQFNPFSKTASSEYSFESEDFKQATARLRHLSEIKGIGLFTGLSGTGKTYTLKKFADSLNPSLYKILYLPLSTLTVLEFYRAMAIALGIAPAFRKIDLFNSIQERIISMSTDKRITTVIILDEGQYLNVKILNDLKILLNFDMDSRNHAVTIIAGQPVLSSTLSTHLHEALAQRIVINYAFNGLCKNELQAYIDSRFKVCGVHANIFDANALEALWGCCGNSPRVINSLVEKCLHIGFQQKAKSIDTEIVMLASSEISLV